MIRILITGKGSYIGTHFRDYLLNGFPGKYSVDELDMIGDAWKNYDFSGYDVVYHVAGIVHMKEKKENESLYYSVNRDLVYAVAEKAKKAGVGQFIFMSTMSVYGLIYSRQLITKNTECHPVTYYGKSKYEAEKLLMSLADDSFRVCVLRPPMVYGKNSPGNMTKLIKMIRKVKCFPTVRNERSSISIEKLISVVKECVDQKADGLVLPQNDQYLCTYDIIREVMAEEHVHVHYISIFNPLIRFLIGKETTVTKCFGDLKYEK